MANKYLKTKAVAEDAIVVEQTNTLPAKMPVFNVKSAASYEVTANFGEVETYLKGIAAKYKDLVFTEENIEQAKVIKAELVTLRTSLAKIQDNVKRERFNNPKKIFDAKMESLLAIIGTTETGITAALNKEDQKRIDDINEALDVYKENFVKFHCLEAAYAARIEYKKSYYNKGAVEKDSKADLEAQVKVLKAEQVARNGSIKLIQKALKDCPEINEEAQIEKLDSGLDVASILEWIDTEIERLAALKAAPKFGGGGGSIGIPGSPADSDDYLPEDDEEGTDIGQDGEPEEEPLEGRVMADAEKIDFASDFPKKTKTRTVVMEYPIDTGDALTSLFKMLRTYGIIITIKKD